MLADLRMPGMDGHALLDRLPAAAARDHHHAASTWPAPPRAAALLRKDELTRERLAFAIRSASRATR